MRRRDFLVSVGGAAIAISGIARTQTGKVPTVGYLWHAGSAREEHPYFEALVDGFAALGYVDGRNIRLEHRFPNETPARFKSMAAELVALSVDVLMGGAGAAPYLRDATTRIPIVFMFVPDPVGMGLVTSLARPGRNITGLSNFGRETAGKRLQLLREVVPSLSRVALLINPEQQGTTLYVEAFRAATDHRIGAANIRSPLAAGIRAGVRRDAERPHPGDDAGPGRNLLSRASHRSEIGARAAHADVRLFQGNV